MRSPILVAPAAGAAALGAYLARERRRRKDAERLAAAALESLLRAIDANDQETGAHVRRVAAYALTLADHCEVAELERRTIELAALFHDIGKIHEALFDLVHEPRRLTRAERRAITRHPALGADVLAPIGDFFPDLEAAVFAHHEHWDGSGYPRGVRGTRIPFAARVVALADTFDVLTFGRPYQSRRQDDEVAEIIAGARGTQFDPDLVDLALFPPIFDRLNRSRRTFARRGAHVPERSNGGAARRVPRVKIRWRTRTPPPPAVRERLDQD